MDLKKRKNLKRKNGVADQDRDQRTADHSDAFRPGQTGLNGAQIPELGLMAKMEAAIDQETKKDEEKKQIQKEQEIKKQGSLVAYTNTDLLMLFPYR